MKQNSDMHEIVAMKITSIKTCWCSVLADKSKSEQNVKKKPLHLMHQENGSTQSRFSWCGADVKTIEWKTSWTGQWTGSLFIRWQQTMH